MPHPFFGKLVTKAETNADEAFYSLFDTTGLHTTLGFADMRAKIAATSAMFRQRGLRDGDIVLIFAQHGSGMLLSFFGAQWHGAIPAFMPPPTAKQDVQTWVASHTALIERIQPALIVAEPGCIEHVRALWSDNLISTEDVESADSVDDVRLMLAEDDLDRIAFLQHSSGTTGLKKGVMVTYRQLLSQLETYAKRLALNPDKASIVSWLPLYHDMGLIAATLMPFYFGLPVRLIETFSWLSNPGLLISHLTEAEEAYCWLPNFAFSYMAKRTRLDMGPDDLQGVRAIINCSEPCKAEDMEAFMRRFEPHGLKDTAVQVCYAMAEYVFAVSQSDLTSGFKTVTIEADAFEAEHLAITSEADDKRLKTIVSVGRPVDDVEVRVGEGLPEGHVGEITVRGPSMCVGYFRNEALTQRKFADGWYHTGDLGFMLAGELFITGRMDDLIIVRGKNIYAHDLEEMMTATQGVKAGRSVAFGIDDPAAGTQKLILVVEIEDVANAKMIVRDIYDRICDSFGVAPSDIVPVAANSLSKTTSGKISRAENSKKYLGKMLDTLGVTV